VPSFIDPAFRFKQCRYELIEVVATKFHDAPMVRGRIAAGSVIRVFDGASHVGFLGPGLIFSTKLSLHAH
jgi:hypothetical protein